ncbi:auxin-responsive protein SAUR64-like [Pistacia vera]|uniref:auxin-responsive protein SAUR64-like n=1 Tax=Pistacia vera TaxID=55513 RepID=UPI001263B285|nr:auxin-responsive protein SAUR64-like [Pistacia vera]
MSSMICSKKLSKMERKWQNFAAIKRKRISLPRIEVCDGCTASSPTHKGHFVVYTSDQKRFVIPLEYLNNKIFRELLKLSQEEFGLQIDGPIIVPCDASFMEYIVMLIERGAEKDLEITLLMSFVTACCISPSLFYQEHTNQQALVWGY